MSLLAALAPHSALTLHPLLAPPAGLSRPPVLGFHRPILLAPSLLSLMFLSVPLTAPMLLSTVLSAPSSVLLTALVASLLLTVLLASLLPLLVALLAEPGLAVATALPSVLGLLPVVVSTAPLAVLLASLTASLLLPVSPVTLLSHLPGPLPPFLAPLAAFPRLPVLPPFVLVPLSVPLSVGVSVVLAHGFTCSSVAPVDRFPDAVAAGCFPGSSRVSCRPTVSRAPSGRPVIGRDRAGPSGRRR